MTDQIVELFQTWRHLSLASGIALALFFLAALVVFPAPSSLWEPVRHWNSSGADHPRRPRGR